jgi:hypothetical protein
VLPVEFYNRIMGIETLKPAAPLAAAQVVTPEATPAPVTPEPELVKASEPAMEEEPQEEEVKETEETLDDGDAPAPAEEPEQELGQIDTGFEASGKD